MAFSSHLGTLIHLGFPAISEAAVPARRPLLLSPVDVRPVRFADLGYFFPQFLDTI